MIIYTMTVEKNGKNRMTFKTKDLERAKTAYDFMCEMATADVATSGCMISEVKSPNEHRLNGRIFTIGCEAWRKTPKYKITMKVE